MIKLFTADDFKEFTTRLYPDAGCAEYIADAANAKLYEWLKLAPEVYGCDLTPEGRLRSWIWVENPEKNTTYSAKLIDLKKLGTGVAE